MCKKIMIFALFIMSFFLVNMDSVWAKQIKLTGNAVTARKGPGTNYGANGYMYTGEVYTLIDDTIYSSESGCSAGWYKINYQNTTSYICSTYASIYEEVTVDPVSVENCKNDLERMGFPSSYITGLCNLKANHPNWNFVPINTGLDWITAVEKESVCGKSYIETNREDYKDSSCTNPYSHSWYPASKTAVAYYMDPRNWFTDQYIFQFDYLKYDTNLSSSYQTGVNAILANRDFYKYHLNLGTNLSVVIDDAGKSANVSPVFLASRMNQENVAYSLYSGVTSGYEGYYNFFNYGVSDSCATTNGVAYCGLNYAKTYGWNSPYNAITGGANFLSSSYINVGQYTGYLQKYNVSPTNSSKLYTHQYMTNVAAPSSEGRTTYNTYNKLGLINNGFTFYIPVYLNMESNVNNSSSGAVEDTSGTNGASTTPISTIVTSSGYSYSSNYLSGVKNGTDASTLKANIESIAGSGTVTITDLNGNATSSGLLGTGYKISISNSTSTEVLTIVVKGDTSGDGKVNALDLLQIQKSILGTYNLSGATDIAGDTSGDGKVNALDLLQVQKSILGTYDLS